MNINRAPWSNLTSLSTPRRSRLAGSRADNSNGTVTIHSDWKDPGPEDDLWIVTRDVTLTEQTISTPHPVKFQWGPHRGSGSDMMIKLLTDPAGPDGKGSGLNAKGVEWFELRHVEQLHLEMTQPAANPGEQPVVTPVEIRCHGPFRFDAVRHVATFSDRVEVMKRNPAGPADQLNCDELSIYFTERPKQKPRRGAAKTDRKSPDSLDLEPQRIEGRGNPAVATAHSVKDGSAVERGQRTWNTTC